MKRIGVWKWSARGKPAPPPHLIKQKTVKEYARQQDIHILIETGTYFGHMVKATMHTFKRIYSIELDKVLYRRARRKFSKFSHIDIIHGDSSKILSELLSSISQPCLFWLDAHYSGGISGRGDRETPILNELQQILSHPVSNHIILIDDARLFNGQNDYPNLGELKSLISQYGQDYLMEVKYDIIRIHKARISENHGIKH